MLSEKELVGMFDNQPLIKKFLVEETFSPEEYKGYHAIFKFDNKFGASVIHHEGSYGVDSGLLELAVIKFNEDGKWKLTYETTITDDVLGYLTKNEVIDTLVQIKQL